MNKPKPATITIAILLTLTTITAITAINASALPEFLVAGGFPIRFTGRGGLGTLETVGGRQIVCEGGKSEGEIVSATHLTAQLDISNCRIFGIINAHSLGDTGGVILVKLLGLLCYINKARQEVGVKLEFTGRGVHLEVATVLALIEGTLIGKVTPVNTRTLGPFELTLKEVRGVQELQKCEGEAENKHLVTSENEGTAEESGLAAPNVAFLLREAGEIMA